MTIDTSREAIARMTGMWGVGVEPNMARVTEALTALATPPADGGPRCVTR